jgi:hypothetical protein
MRSLRSSGSVGGLAGHRRVYPATDAVTRAAHAWPFGSAGEKPKNGGSE